MWGWVGNIASIAGIAGLSVTNWLDDPMKAWASLAAFVLFLGFLAWRAYLVSKKIMMKHYPEGYVPLSAFAKMTTSDGKTFVYELYRHIQIKQPAMRNFPHNFMWSGSKDPQVSSVLQTVSPVKPIPGENRKQVTLCFPSTRMYNDVEVIHLKMECDDSDQSAIPMIRHGVKHPIRLITFDVELLHAQKAYFGEKAKVTRRETEKGSSAIEEEICTVAFDVVTKSFTYQLLNPEPGYEYQITWPKPALPKPANAKSAAAKASWKAVTP